MTLDLYKLENLHQSTTPGPWKVRSIQDPTGDRSFLPFVQAPRISWGAPYDIEILSDDETLYPTRDADMAWIVAAHEAFPAMLDRIRELSDFLARAKDECSRLRSIVRANNPQEFG